MCKKAALFSLLLFLVISGYAQHELDPYKYIIIPKKYDFLNKENQYRLNTNTKFLFDQEGFTTVIKGEAYPKDLMENPCLAVTADVIDKSGWLSTKLNLVLKDCHDAVVFTSIDGMSKIKEYNKTYTDALKKCFVSIEQLEYNYDPAINKNNNLTTQTTAVAVVTQTKAEVKETEVAAATVAPEKNEATVVAPASQKVAEPMVAAAVAVPVASAAKQPEEKTEPEATGVMARNFQNENISFFLIEQGDQLVAYVNESKNANYKKGELIGTFEKTSLPNVFRVNWKKKEQDIDETTAYIDDAGNLKIDIHRNGKIEVITFSEVK